MRMFDCFIVALMITLSFPACPATAIVFMIYLSEKFLKKLKLGVDN